MSLLANIGGSNCLLLEISLLLFENNIDRLASLVVPLQGLQTALGSLFLYPIPFPAGLFAVQERQYEYRCY